MMYVIYNLAVVVEVSAAVGYNTGDERLAETREIDIPRSPAAATAVPTPSVEPLQSAEKSSAVGATKTVYAAPAREDSQSGKGWHC